MTYTPFNAIPIGSLNWGAPVNNAFIALDESQVTNARDHNLLAWTWDPSTNLASSTITAGTVAMSKVWLRQPATVTNVIFGLAAFGATLTAGQNFAGLYNAAGTRVGVTADQTAAWTAGTLGAQEVALTAPFAAPAGAYYVAFLFNGTTSPGFARGSAAASGPSTVNLKLTAADARYANGPAAQTSLPASITMASRTPTAPAFWVALS